MRVMNPAFYAGDEPGFLCIMMRAGG